MAVIVGVGLSGQTTDFYQTEVNRAGTLLKSPYWRDKAWGAYLAGGLRADALNQELIGQVRTASTLRGAVPGTEEHTFVTMLLAALIEAAVPVPSNLVEPFLEAWPDASIILLASGSDSDQVLLRLASEKSRDVVWLASNNILAERRSKHWYAALLNQLIVTHRFLVVNQGIAVGAGEGGGACGDGVAVNLKGFPPLILYTLADFAERGSLLLAKGPMNVYYKRTIVPSGKQVGLGRCGRFFNRMEIRIGYLAQLRSVPFESAKQMFRAETSVQYTTDENLRRDCERSMAVQEQSIQEFLKALADSGLDTPEMDLQIVPQVVDRRNDAQHQLACYRAKDSASWEGRHPIDL